jgi:hypothetical protein
MKNFRIIAAALLFSFNCCQKNEIREEATICIQQKINEFKSSATSCETGKTVYRYKFQEAYVYVFNPGNCGADMMSDVYDSQCNLICGLGGIAGNIMCNGKDFGKNASDETLIWKN